MRILYLDTSSSFLYCGLVEGDKLLFQIKEELGKKMSEFSLFMLSQKFSEYSISTDSVDKIILVNGPGSFTGVRIGITIAKTYAWAFSIPVVVISSLLAMSISSKKVRDFYIPLIDARRGFVYSGVYDCNFNPVLSDKYINLDTLKIAIEKLGNNYNFISNDSFSSIIEIEKYDPDILRIVDFCYNMQACENVHLIDANYLKSTEAEEKLNDNFN